MMTTAYELHAVLTDNGYAVRDEAGGVWHPTEPCSTPGEALARCQNEPDAGSWS